MTGLLKILGVMFLTLFGLILLTSYEPGTFTSVSRIAGFPVIEISQEGARGWIAIGQVDARGVIVFAQVGVGLVAFVQAGAGLFFCIGQGAASMVMFGQAGIGLSFFLGQVGVGVQAWGQAAYKSRPHLKLLSAEFSELLALRYKAGRFSRTQLESKAVPAESDSAPLPGSWPEGMLNALTHRGSGASIALEDGVLRVETYRFVFEGKGGEVLVIDEANPAVVQLSRSQRPRKWAALLTLFGKDPWQHWGHVELRTQHRRIQVSAPLPESALAGLPFLEQRAATCTEEALLDLLSTAKVLDLQVASGDAGATVITSTIPKKAVLFEGLKALLRGPTVALYFAPFLLIPKLILFATDAHVGDWITVGYTCLLVVFFMVLAIVVLLYPWVGPPQDLLRKQGSA